MTVLVEEQQTGPVRKDLEMSQVEGISMRSSWMQLLIPVKTVWLKRSTGGRGLESRGRYDILGSFGWKEFGMLS